ncbi:hypothetical protein BN1723_014571 [Verticillium longisporum]|uniref:Zn(2)-C6 fungal-type domain-containing protein n=1 Tax=Verticillium longisporum TaxID=100787 RepID=A0A0G4MCR1_VERLO|nr:Activator of stress genes 1 like protein [Verticillium longisporum]CRK31906.1 hypothetical protein BN1723_014571 [Verticillium longisporum]
MGALNRSSIAISSNEQQPENSTPFKRPAAASSTGEPAAKKRAKYTTNACKQCQKRKLKCIRADNQLECQRCITDGATCVVAPNSTTRAKDVEVEKESQEGTIGDDSSSRENPQMESLVEDISRLQQQVATLIEGMRELTERGRSSDYGVAPLGTNQQVSPAYSAHARASRHKSAEPMQPHFVGPTRPAFSLRIAEISLTRMGIGSNEALPPSAPDSRAGSPGPSSPEPQMASQVGLGYDPLLTFAPGEILRLLDVFQEEVESVYPFIEVARLAAGALQVLAFLRNPEEDMAPSMRRALQKDMRLMKVAIATGIVIEAHGRNDASTLLTDSVEAEISYASRLNVDLKEVQLCTMLSIYHFHCDEELLAWRLIGTAARTALEMGLHRKQSLVDNFQETHDRNLAVRLFWCIYALDRRWSFGTSLSFALHDRDIDPELPEPGEGFQYLSCMVAYGRLCSKVWEALPLYGPSTNCIPKDTVGYLDYMAQNWLVSIPRELQLRHPRLGLAPRMQPRVTHRLRTLLYLRGNHIRIMIHRHYVLTSAAIESDIQAARNVVEIAQDSLQVLVHLNDSSDIYVRQQSAFNYFLLSSLAVIFLAVCHAPATFAEPCRDSFLAALQLVKGFSRHGSASRRLWKSIRGLVPRVKSLALRSEAEKSQMEHDKERQAGLDGAQADVETAVEHTYNGGGMEKQPWQDMWPPMDEDVSPGLSSSIPDAFHMSVDLMSLFDSFGMPPDSAMATGSFEGMVPMEGADEISRRFQGLI